MFQKIYYYFPIFIQNILVSIYGFYWKHRRYGGVFKNYLSVFKSHEKYTKQEWTDYQTRELRKLLTHAFTNVPFYKKLYTKYGFSLKDFEEFEISDLKKLPYLEKEDLRKYGTTELLSDVKENGKFYSSSGSTGTPIQIYFSEKFHQIWSALYEVRVRNWAGVNYKNSRAMIGGRRVVPITQFKPPFYRFNKAENQYYFSSYNISPETTKYYIEDLKKANADYLVGYAMSIYLLAQNIELQKLKAPIFKAVLTSSEKMTFKMRETIQNVFKCKVYDAYSGVEACGLISENNDGELLFSPESGIIEIIDSEGSDVKLGEIGEVISTGLLNYNQPLIRYRIGDSVKISKNQKTNSGIHMLKVDEIIGRTEDVIIGMKGQQMVRFHSVFIDIPFLVMSQVIQNSEKNITIKLVVEELFDKRQEQVMLERIQSQLGAVLVRFEYVSEIERTKGGKFKAVISNINNG
jgi:phenylacetate-CoA ligase